MNRRNVLIGIGTAAVGSGVALGSGAFTQVDATRTVNVETSGDTGALIGLDILSDDLDDQGNDDVITFDTNTDLNVDAITRFDGAFQVTNNRASGDGPVNVDILDSSGSSIVTTDASNVNAGMWFEDPSDDLTGISDDGSSATVNVVFNLEGEDTVTAANGVIPGEITVQATPN